MSIEAMKQALEALEYLQPTALTSFYTIGDRDKAITSLRQAIKAAEKQEPFCWAQCTTAGLYVSNEPDEYYTMPLYTTPQPQQAQEIDWKDQYEKQKRRSDMWQAKYEKDIGPIEKAGPVAAQPQADELTIAYMDGLHQGKKQREWVGLTDDEVTQQVGDSHVLRDVVRAVEHVLKEKNT